MKLILFAIIVCSFLISPNLLFMAGVGYSSTGGGMVEKIHLATYLAIIGFVLQFALRKKNKLGYMQDAEVYRYIGATALLAIYCVAMGYVSSIPIVTLMTPLLIYSIVQHTDKKFVARLGVVIRIILVANASLGIAEALGGFTLLERVAGDVVVLSDTRAIGFVGHPLTSSLLSALMAIYLIREATEARFTMFRAAELMVHLVGLIAFGGRVALVLTIVLAIWAVLFGKAKPGGGRKLRSSQIALRVGLFGAFVVGGFFLGTSEFAEATINRFMGDQNADASTESRFSAFLILFSMEPEEWFLGVPEARRVALMGAFDTDFGIEITWISWILSFGVIWTLVLVYILYRIIKLSTRGRASSLRYMSILFLVAITGAQGLGGKTLMLSWFLMMLLCFDQPPVGRSSLSSGRSLRRSSFRQA